MKKITLLLAICLCYLRSVSQVSFSLNANLCSSVNYQLVAQTGTASANGYTWTVLPATAVFSNPNASITTIQFTAPGAYTLNLAALVSGTIVTATQPVSVYATPTLTSIQSSYTTCITSNLPKYSKPISITMLGASSYSWLPIIPPGIIPNNGQQQVIRPSSSICYTVTGFTSVCSNSTVVCATVVPQFTISVGAISLLRCIPDSAKLFVASVQNTALAPYTYSWTESSTGTLITLDNNLTPSVTAFPTQMTSYTVQVLDRTNCVSEIASITLSVANCTSVFEHSSEVEAMALVPNPSKGLCSLFLNGGSRHASSLLVYDYSGKQVYSQNIPPDQAQKQIDLDLSALPSGIYLIEVSQDGKHLNHCRMVLEN